MSESKRDMENIQRNLEDFLEQELKNNIETSSSDYEDIVRAAYQGDADLDEERGIDEREPKESGSEESGFSLKGERLEQEPLYQEENSFGKAHAGKKVHAEKKAHAGKNVHAGRNVHANKKTHVKKKKSEGKSRRQDKKSAKKESFLKRKRSERKERLKEEKDRGREDLSKKKQSKGRKNKEQEEERKSGFGKFLSVLVCFFVLLCIAWYIGISGIYGKMKYESVGQLAGESMTDNGVVNILLIGTDARSSEEAGRSDAMILLSVSSKTKTVHMTSLLRDMYVEIPGHDGNRLNAAYAYGGPELLLETVSDNFDIDVNRYVVVDFQTFANLVDAVGGVDLELSNEEVQWVNAYLNEYNILRNMPLETDYLDTSLSGVIHLNGPQALAYSRNRYIGSDFGRTERQRKVLGAVADNIASAVISNPLELIDGVFSELTTNLSKSECLQLSLMSAKLLTYDIVQSSIPLSGTYRDATIRGMAVLEVDFEKNKEYIRSEIYGE